MRRPTSLERRLGLGLAVAVTAMWIVGTIVAGFVVRHELDEAFDDGMENLARRVLLSVALDVAQGRDIRPPTQVIGEEAEEDELAYAVRDRDGRIVLSVAGDDGAVVPAEPVEGFLTTPTSRLYGETSADGAFRITVGESLEHRNEVAFEAALGLVTPLPVLIPLSLIGVWWLLRRSLRPLRDLKTEIEARGGADLSPIVTTHLPTEIGPIAEATNQLMDRLRHALEAERSFTANSAHELRTPIAAALAQTQRLIAETRDDTTRERARQIETTLHHLARLSEKLMQLARAEGGGLIAETPHDLARVMPHVVDDFRSGDTAPSRVRLTMPPGFELWSRMDTDAFAIMMRNLIENALKHGRPGTPVEVVGETDGTLHVINACTAVPPEKLASLKGRFARGGAGGEGAGLGLAIVDAIASGAGATLDLRSPATGRSDGFEAVLTLPGAERR